MIVLLLVLLLRVNLSMFLVGVGLFSLLSFALDSLFHFVGFALLTTPSLQGFWTYLYNSPIWRFAYFNNTIVMGSFVVAVVMFVPLFWLTTRAVQRYREQLLERLKKIGIVQMIMAGRLYSLYQMAAKWGGKV